MTDTELQVYDKLLRLEIGPQDIELTFTRRLARDNGWTLSFAERTILEYKRFLFLAKFAGHPVTPSDEVDQAWHLHLVYTDSYWNETCAEVLEIKLHHGPTKGGKKEGEKFGDWYQRTLDSYLKYFKTPPPSDIWPNVTKRFQNVASFRRVNTAYHLVVSKRALFTLGSAIIFLLPMLGCIGEAGFINPITEFSTPQFLAMYALLVASTVAIRFYQGVSPLLKIVGYVVCMIGVARIYVGAYRDHPVGFVYILTLAEAFIMSCDFSKSSNSDASGCGSSGGGGCGGGGCGGCGS